MVGGLTHLFPGSFLSIFETYMCRSVGEFVLLDDIFKMDQFYVCQSFPEFVSHCLMDSMTEADLSGMDRERGTSPVGHGRPFVRPTVEPGTPPVHSATIPRLIGAN